MFIRVKYGDDETLLCNPSCSIINLLSSIRTRSGNTDDDIVIDLTDETGFLNNVSVFQGEDYKLYQCREPRG